jgi:hypothetical protein
MDKPIEQMTYAEFKDWCNERACDGRWSLVTALACIEMMKKIDSVKGFFNRKKKQELAWQKLISETLSEQ